MKKKTLFLWLLGIFPFLAIYAQPSNNNTSTKLSGTIRAGIVTYNADTSYQRQAPLTWLLQGSPTLYSKNWRVSTNFIFTSNSTSTLQPFQRYGATAQYKSLKIHAGHRSLNFSPFVFNGQPILGVGAEWSPKIIRLGYMKGNLSSVNFIDTTRSIPSATVVQPQYGLKFQRQAQAMKLGFGKERNHLDFTFFKAKDPRKASYPSSYKTAQNAALGIDALLSFGKHVTWSANFGISAYTPETPNALDLLALDKQFGGGLNNSLTKIHNDTTYPKLVRRLADTSTLTWINRNLVEVVPGATQFGLAGETNLGLFYDNFSLKVTERLISPNYRSMGIFYIQTDIRQRMISPEIRLLQGKISLALSGGKETNSGLGANLYKSNRTIGSLSLVVTPSSSWSHNVQFSNYGLSQQPRFVAAGQRDTFALVLVNRNYSYTGNLNLLKDSKIYNVSLNLSLQKSSDIHYASQPSNPSKSFFGNLSHTFMQSDKRFNLTSSVNYFFNTYSIAYNDTRKDSYKGVSLGVGKGFFKNKLYTNASVLTNFVTTNSTANGVLIGYRGLVNYRPQKHHRLGLGLNFLDHRRKQTNSYHEFFTNLNYSYIF